MDDTNENINAFHQFRNMCEKCLSDTLCETDGE